MGERAIGDVGPYRSWMSYIRDFGRWLNVHGRKDAYVLSDQWKAPFVPARPYLLTSHEIELFFGAAARLGAQSPWRWQATAFFTLMHSCGIRTGEARALLVEHVDLPGRHVEVVLSKGNRSRRLPLTDEVTAARVGEITALTLQDLVLAKPGHVRLTGKRNKTRIVPLTDKTVEHLHVYLAEFHPGAARLPAARPVFYSVHLGQPTALSVDTVSAVLKQAAHTARTNCRTVPEDIHCHMLRKTKAMDLYQQGIPLPIIMRLLGHENTSTTAAFYAFATIDMMRDAVNAATPAIGAPAEQWLTEDTLQAVYSLR